MTAYEMEMKKEMERLAAVKLSPQPVFFGSAKQIENYFAERLDGMSRMEAMRYLESWCEDYKIVPTPYTASEICNLLIADFDPTHGLEYLGF